MIKTPTKELKDWYWTYGYKREGIDQIPGSWINQVYAGDYAVKAIEVGSLKPTLAIWGPSQTGKSTLMSKIIDSEDKSKSALMWSDKVFLFDQQRGFIPNDKRSTKSLNSYNNGGDASACASRFYLSDSVDDIEHPVSIEIAEKRDLLHTLVEGYLTQFSQEDEDGVDDVWTIEKIEELLKELPNSNRPLVKGATELIFDFIFVLDRMIESSNNYYSQLKKRDIWKSTLRNKILSHSTLCSSQEEAEKFIQTILWKNEELLNKKFKELFQWQEKFSNIVSNRKLKCSLEFASYLLNMDACNDKETIAKFVKEMVLIEDENSDNMIITESNSLVKKFFDNSNEFYVFQLLVWELAFPLNKNILNDNPSRGIDALGEFDILDLPGISNYGKNIDKENFKEENFTALFKRGKSASIIYKYAESMSISALLLTIRAGRIVEDTSQLSSGIHSIFSRLDSNFSLGNREKTPAPISICYSFFIQSIDDYIAGDRGKESLDNYEEQFQLGDYGHPDNVYSFVTNFYWYRDGQSRTVEEAYADHPKELMDGFISLDWVKNRFHSPLERDSIIGLLNQSDGGVSYLMDAQKSIISSRNFNTVKENRKIQLHNEIESLVATRVPTTDDNREIEQIAISKLLNYLETRVDELKEERKSDYPVESLETDILSLSQGLRNILSCERDELDDITRLEGTVELGDFYIKELVKWENSAKRMNILSNFQMSAPEQSLILKLLSSKFLSKDDFTEKYLNIWSSWNRKSNKLSRGEGESYRKIISKQMSNDLYHKEIKFIGAENFSSLTKNCENVYKIKEKYRKFGLVNVHLDSTIPKLIEQLESILGNAMIPERKVLDGDFEIIELQKHYYPENKNLNEGGTN